MTYRSGRLDPPAWRIGQIQTIGEAEEAARNDQSSLDSFQAGAAGLAQCTNGGKAMKRRN
jgi:hypothetical protein